MNVLEIRDHLLELVDLIAAAALKHLNPVDDEISERKARKKFGTTWISYHEARNNIVWTRRGVCKNSPKVTSLTALIALREAEKIGSKAIIKELS